jgi:hypothetical protein
LRCRYRLLTLLATALLTAAAQNQTPAKAPGKTASSDAALEKSIAERFSRSKCAEDKFTVRVQGGVATIEGKTEVVQRKAAATRMARTAGASKVVNKVLVSQVARDKASANLETGRRRAQVKRSDAAR